MSVIRQLELKDAEQMLECLNDSSNMKYLAIGEQKHSIDDCKSFVLKSQIDRFNKHFAIVDENNRWIGTVSLKNIDCLVKQAELAIITASNVHGKGYAKRAIDEVLTYAFLQLGLNRVYLNVIDENISANRLYKKCGFSFEGTAREAIIVNKTLYNLNWYSILKSEFEII